MKRRTERRGLKPILALLLVFVMAVTSASPAFGAAYGLGGDEADRIVRPGSDGIEALPVIYLQPEDVKSREIRRIMAESLKRFNHEECAREYIKLYERMLDRPLVKREIT